jgi:hypothetical protein
MVNTADQDLEKSLLHELSNEKNNDTPTKPLDGMSNFTILLITAILFGVFVVAEIIGALVSNERSSFLIIHGDVNIILYIINIFY